MDMDMGGFLGWRTVYQRESGGGKGKVQARRGADKMGDCGRAGGAVGLKK